MVSRCQYVIFPLAAAALTVILNGAPVPSYEQPRLERGHVVAPLAPFVTHIATRIEFDNGTMIVRRGPFVARIRTGSSLSFERLERTYVSIAPIYRALGAHCSYDAATRSLRITTVELEPVQTMEPYGGNTPAVQPTTVFTAQPAITPRPVFKGVPRPRRTPIAVKPSRP